jgi:hypothetical protein
MLISAKRENRPTAHALGMAAIVVVGSGILVGGVASQEVVERDEHGMDDGHDRFLVAPMRHPPAGARGSTDAAAVIP